MTRDAVRAGAKIGSNSWGDDTQGRYDISAAEFDELVRDADALTLGDQPYILEFSAGNAGPASQTMDSPAVGKNVIATGASQNDRAGLFIYEDGPDAMADFSSRGPAEDGRIKPDLVAPGTWIASLQSESASSDNAWLPIDNYYQFQGGTSQAGPHVSGAAAVFVQYYRSLHTNATPSPALVKAALINSAVDMDDFAGTAAIPNGDEGWGRVDLTRIIGSPRRYEFDDQTILLSTGQTNERHAFVSSSAEPLKITLTYTDVPGFPGAIPALVNDLDLEVVGPDGMSSRTRVRTRRRWTRILRLLSPGTSTPPAKARSCSIAAPTPRRV
jgi:subtilisin family serine protease